MFIQEWLNINVQSALQHFNFLYSHSLLPRFVVVLKTLSLVVMRGGILGWSPTKRYPESTVSISLLCQLPWKSPFSGLVIIWPDSELLQLGKFYPRALVKNNQLFNISATWGGVFSWSKQEASQKLKTMTYFRGYRKPCTCAGLCT